jgi:hypothetical protein
MSNGWLMSHELNGKRTYNDLIGISFNILQNEPRTISSTSVRAGRHPPNYLTDQLPIEVDNS